MNLDGALWSEVGRVGLDRPALQVLAEHGEFAVAAEDAVKGGAAPTVEWFEAERRSHSAAGVRCSSARNLATPHRSAARLT